MPGPVVHSFCLAIASSCGDNFLATNDTASALAVTVALFPSQLVESTMKYSLRPWLHVAALCVFLGKT